MRVLGVLLLSALVLDCGRVEESPAATEEIRADDVSPVTDAPAPQLPPASRYVAMPGEECIAELLSRGIEFARVEREGLQAPVRLLGPLSGVRFRTLLPEKERARSPYEVSECRFVLALDDFARQLRERNVVDVMYFSAFRPLVPGVAPRSHEVGLAMDIAYFVRSDRTSMNVLRDFDPFPFDRPCTSPPLRPDASELRRIACEAASSGLFHLVLTPDYDAAHRDHFHLELIPGATEFVAR